MFQDFTQGDHSPTHPPTHSPDPQYEIVRHTIFGTLTAIQNTIKLLHKLNYADPNDWSKPLPTGRANEMMAILTKRIRVS